MHFVKKNGKSNVLNINARDKINRLARKIDCRHVQQSINSQKHNALVTEGQILHDSSYLMYLINETLRKN